MFLLGKSGSLFIGLIRKHISLSLYLNFGVNRHVAAGSYF
jgi:hypothetical protein